MKHFIDLEDYTQSEIDSIIATAGDIAACPQLYAQAAEGKIMSSLFYEPSTRTQLSFAVAMKRLGGQVIGFSDISTTSVQKGESLKDTAAVIGGYSDVMVIRSPVEGFPAAAAIYAGCPVINAGDGSHLHPTQTLTDLRTLSCEKRLSGLTVGVCGDLKYGRTVHSLVKSLAKYSGNRFVFISGEKLRLPAYLCEYLRTHGVVYSETQSLLSAVSELDVLYMTRVQRERFERVSEFDESRGLFVLGRDEMYSAKDDLVVLHPLPRNEEIDVAVDDDPRMKFFAQARYGQYVRMALILHLLDPKRRDDVDVADVTADVTAATDKARHEVCISEHHVCGNLRCVTQSEAYLPKHFRKTDGKLSCIYCESEAIAARKSGA